MYIYYGLLNIPVIALEHLDSSVGCFWNPTFESALFANIPYETTYPISFRSRRGAFSVGVQECRQYSPNECSVEFHRNVKGRAITSQKGQYLKKTRQGLLLFQKRIIAFHLLIYVYEHSIIIIIITANVSTFLILTVRRISRCYVGQEMARAETEYYFTCSTLNI